MRKWTIALAAVLAGGFATAATAQETPPTLPKASTDVTLGGTSYLDPGTYNTMFDYSPYSSGTMEGSAQLAPDPSVSATVTSCCSEYGAGSARVDLIYYAELTGPDLGPVPMELFATLASSQAGADAYGWAQVEVTTSEAYQEILFSDGERVVDGAITSLSNPDIIPFEATPGQLIEIALSVNAGAVQGSTSSSVDPFLTIDPSFAATDPNFSTDYSLFFSPGIVNALASSVSGVPEPSTWALMLLGFGAVGAAMGRGRRQQLQQLA